MNQPAPSCPRCGYDLSGHSAAWTDSCPLRGTCSECGLHFEWARLLDARLRLPVRYFEHALRQRRRAFLRTLYLAARPWKLWRTIGMEDEVRPGRLALFAILGGPTTHVAAVFLPIAAFLVFELVDRLTAAAPPWGRPPWQHSLGDGVLEMALPYGFRPHQGSYVPDWSTHWNPAVLAGVLTWSAMPLVFLLLPQTLRRARVRRVHLRRIWCYSLAVLPLALLSWGLPAFVAGCAERLDPPKWGGPPPLFDTYAAVAWLCDHTILLFTISVVGGSAVFWGFAASRYLKLPRPWAVATVMAALSSLLAVAAVMLLPGLGVRMWMDTV